MIFKTLCSVSKHNLCHIVSQTLSVSLINFFPFFPQTCLIIIICFCPGFVYIWNTPLNHTWKHWLPSRPFKPILCPVSKFTMCFLSIIAIFSSPLCPRELFIHVFTPLMNFQVLEGRNSVFFLWPVTMPSQVLYKKRKWKWSRSVMSDSLWPHGLCNPMDCGLPGSSIHGILQTRILEWVAISFSRGSS